MPKITFMPMGIVCKAKPGETILEVAINNQIPIQHACGGFCACTTCHILVKSGGSALSSKEEEELERLDRLPITPEESRLGCQAQIQGDVTVEIVNLEI